LKRLERSVARAGALIVVLGAAVAVLPATAAAVTPPLSITVSTSGPLAPGSTTDYLGDAGVTYGITYTLKAASTDTLTGVGFADALPSGAALDDEVGETAKNCGTPFVPGNQPGATSVIESGLTVIGSSASNYVGSCTITLEFVANSVEVASADATTLASGGYLVNGSTTATTATITDLALTVAGLPTLSVTGVTSNATYGYGLSVDLGFSAAPGANDSIAPNGVYATDDQGNTLATGQAVNTDVPGDHQVQVWVQTVDGYLGSQTYAYTVDSPKLTAVKTTRKGDVDFDVEYLAAGSVAAKVVAGKTVVGQVTKRVTVGNETVVTVAPSAAGRQALTKLTTTTKKVKVRVKVKVKVKVKGKTKTETKTETKTVRKTTTKSTKVALSVLYTAADYGYIGSQPTITKTGITLR
jgi:hypothetical protein